MKFESFIFLQVCVPPMREMSKKNLKSASFSRASREGKDGKETLWKLERILTLAVYVSLGSTGSDNQVLYVLSDMVLQKFRSFPCHEFPRKTYNDRQNCPLKFCRYYGKKEIIFVCWLLSLLIELIYYVCL